MNLWTPDIVVLGPGGAKGILFVGALERLFEEKISQDVTFLDNVKTWVGVSVGASICLMLVAGYTIEEINEICVDLNLIDDIMKINLDEARQKLGLIRNKTIEEKLRTYISLKFGYIPSLAQLYMLSGVKLSLVTFNLDKMRPEFLDKDTEPELSCVEAAMMSMAVPILMQPRKYKGLIYVDGAIGAPYPVLTFDHDENKVLGIYISSEEDLYCSDKKPANFFYRLIQASMTVLRNIEIKYSSKNVKHIPIKTLIRDTTGISIDKDSRQMMIEQGYKCADAFLKINSNPDKYKLLLSENEEIPF